MRVRRMPALLAVIIGPALAGEVSAQVPPPKAATPKRVVPVRPVVSEGAELVIVVTDKALEVPRQVEAGLVNVRLFNRSSGPQHITILKVDRLDRVATISEYLRSGDWNVPWINRMGGPESMPPGGVSSVSMVLEAGRYVVAQLPTAYKPGASLLLRDVVELAVVAPTGVASPAALPPAPVTLTMYEWNYQIEGPLNAGRRTIRVNNTGQFEHEVEIVRLLPGRTVDQAVKWAENPGGTAPYEWVGGTTSIGRGRSVNVTVDLMPGDYVLLCTSYNPLSKRGHTQHGMMKQVRVTP